MGCKGIPTSHTSPENRCLQLLGDILESARFEPGNERRRPRATSIGILNSCEHSPQCWFCMQNWADNFSGKGGVMREWRYGKLCFMSERSWSDTICHVLSFCDGFKSQYLKDAIWHAATESIFGNLSLIHCERSGDK